jgi:PKD repeat protein
MRHIPERRFIFYRHKKLITAVMLLLLSSMLTASIEVVIPAVDVNTNESVEVPVSVTGIETSDIYSVYMEIYFDPDVVAFVNVSTSDCITESWGTPFYNTPGDSVFTFAVFGTSPLSGDGDLCKINFDVVAETDANTSLSFLNFLFNEGSPAANTTNGAIIVTDRIPDIEPVEDFTVSEGDFIDFYVNATDPFSLDLTLEAVDLPINAIFTDDGFGIGHFEWQTTQTSAGEYMLGFSATNTESFSDTLFVNILVENVLNVWLPEIDTPIVTDITIPVYTDELADLNVYSFYTKILYDPTVISPTDVSVAGTLCDGWGNLSFNLFNSGELIISVFDTNALTGSGNLINIEFDVTGSDGTFSDLEFEFFVYNDGTPSADISDGVIYIGTPVAEFTGDITEGFSPLVINFTDLSVAGPNAITEWSWDFGDGGTSDLQNPTHTFFETGNYSVSLTVTNSESSANSETKTDYIEVLPIEANFTANPTSGYFPAFDVDFADSSTGNITEWYWDFQNNGSFESFEQNPTYTYTSPGIFSVKLLVSDGTNYAEFTRENFITVSIVPPKAPEDIHIDIVNNNAEITWTEVTMSILDTPLNIDFYLIYASGDPNGDFMYIGYSPTNSFTHPGVPLFVDKMFYRVKAFFGTRENLTEYIDNETIENIINKEHK